MVKNVFIVIIIPLAACILMASKTAVLKLDFVGFRTIKIPEPSDIAIDTENNLAYIVSDNGILFETDLAGNVLRRAEKEGQDFEGVEVHNGHIYVVDERIRRIYQYDQKTLSVLASWYVPFGGGRNSSYESIAYNKTKEMFMVITEKNPVLIKELNEAFQPVKEYMLHIATDISGARWYEGYLYLLSDEDRKVLKCDPENYKVLEEYSIPVLNPEGIAFDKEGKMYITADDLERLYFFDNTITGHSHH